MVWCVIVACCKVLDPVSMCDLSAFSLLAPVSIGICQILYHGGARVMGEVPGAKTSPNACSGNKKRNRLPSGFRFWKPESEPPEAPA